MSAPVYIDLLMAWIEDQINDEEIFPTSTDTPFPSNYETVIKVRGPAGGRACSVLDRSGSVACCLAKCKMQGQCVAVVSGDRMARV